MSGRLQRQKNFIWITVLFALLVSCMYPEYLPEIDLMQDFASGEIARASSFELAEVTPVTIGSRSDGMQAAVVRRELSRRAAYRNFAKEITPMILTLWGVFLCIFLLRRTCIDFLKFYHFPSFIITYIQRQDGRKR